LLIVYFGHFWKYRNTYVVSRRFSTQKNWFTYYTYVTKYGLSPFRRFSRQNIWSLWFRVKIAQSYPNIAQNVDFIIKKSHTAPQISIQWKFFAQSCHTGLIYIPNLNEPNWNGWKPFPYFTF
jgi:hypothetical protein